MTDQEKVIDKLRKLKAHADSAEKIGSQAEAEAFAEMMQRLLLKHKLEMTDIEFDKMEVEEPVDAHHIDYRKYEGAEKDGIRFKKVRVAWVEWLARIVAKAHFCRIMVHQRSNVISLIGRRSDAEVAEFMIVTLQRLVFRMAIRARLDYMKDCKRTGEVPNCDGFKASWTRAFIGRLSERYEAERQTQAHSSSTALIRFNRSEHAVADWMKENTKKAAVIHGSRMDGNAEGDRRGRAAADSVSLKANVVKEGAVRGALA
jgi:hypothetical protein